MKKTTKLRGLLNSEQLEFLMEAHNGISAKIVEEADFKGIWASGLSISAQFGVRDNNEASWTQVLEVIEFMSDATSIPILLDGDTGYGNFNNVQRLIKKLEQRQIAGVCIEDKLFPKTNSFINGENQPLADIQEFCGKIKAAKDAQSDDDFVLIARVEALIAGWGLAEALKRAEAYYEAGADGILIHSSLRVPDEILAFKREWKNACPVVIVPTKYYATPTQVFRDYHFSIAIWANHLFRAAVTAMQRTAKILKNDEHLLNIEDKVIPVSEVFRLQGANELLAAENRYLPHNHDKIAALILAASRGIELGELTANKPKCMLPIQDKPLLEWIVDNYYSLGVKDITVVRGYKKEMVNLPHLNYVDNEQFESTGELVSLHQGLKSVIENSQDLIIGYGDVLFKKFILQILLNTQEDFAIVVDTDYKHNIPIRPDYVICSHRHSKSSFYEDIYLQQINSQLPDTKICGIWTGLLKVSHLGKQILQLVLETLLEPKELQEHGRMFNLINELIRQGYSVRVLYITGHWLDVDEIEDMIQAGNF